MSSSRIKQILKKPTLLFMTLGHRGFLNWMPDKQYLKMAYKIRMGKPLNLENPQTFNEKLQWLKLYDRRPEYTTMVDKCAAKEYAAKIIGEEHIIPTLGVWGRFEDIDFEKLPDQFVLKCTHDSGGLVICRDKSKLDIESAREKIARSLKHNFFWTGREWPYKDVKPRIIAERYMEDENKAQGLTDYKFFCFHGEPKMIYVSQGLEDHATASISFYDMEGARMPFRRSDYKPVGDDFAVPNNFQEMTVLAEKIAQVVDNAFVRIDLYSINGDIYFSEITFSPCSGMIPFAPEKWDNELGSWIELPM